MIRKEQATKVKKARAVVGNKEEGKGRVMSKKQTKVIKRRVVTRCKETNQNCLMMEHFDWGKKEVLRFRTNHKYLGI